jgi:hypothetical protein
MVLLSMSVVGAIGAPAQDDVCYEEQAGFFPGGPVIWNSVYQAFQAVPTTGGYVFGPSFDFASPMQATMQALANNGRGRIRFDVFVNEDSFMAGTWVDGDAYQIHHIGNSDGAQGWTSNPGGVVGGTYLASGSNSNSWHFDVAFPYMGWQPGDTWFQLFFASLTASNDKPLQYFVDNICVYAVPPLEFRSEADAIVLIWTNAAFALQFSTELSGAYTNILGATSPYTNPIAGAQGFFRLQRQ